MSMSWKISGESMNLERREKVVIPPAVSIMGHGQEQLLLGLGDGNIEQSPLFLLFVVGLIAVRYGDVAVGNDFISRAKAFLTSCAAANRWITSA
jgi:hypothetical protein